MKQKVLSLISSYRQARLFSPAEDAVLRLIETASESKPITQAQIARSAEWLGAHPVYEKQPTMDSTTRQVRAIIMELRKRYGIMILAGSKGYYIAEKPIDALGYLAGHAEEARAVFRKSMMIFHLLKRHLDTMEAPLLQEMGTTLADMVTFQQDGDEEVDLLFYMENRTQKPDFNGIPLSMRIGDKPLSWLDGRYISKNDGTLFRNKYKIAKAYYTGCYLEKNGEAVTGWGGWEPYGWDETGDWMLEMAPNE